MRPARTGKTSLTDDELTLFDVLFDKGLSLEHLYRKDFRFFHNRPYSHHLTRAQIRQRIRRWVREGWVRPRRIDAESPEGETYYDLTPAGGHLWELEREPIWDRFCMHLSWSIEDGADGLDEELPEEEFRVERHISSILCPTPQIAWDIVHAALACAYFTTDLRQAACRRLPLEDEIREMLPPWKEFPNLYEIRLPTLEIWRTDRQCVEERRTWWRDENDLETLKRKLSR